jgi:hypothetical protein
VNRDEVVMSKKIIQFLKNWSSVVVIDPTEDSVRSRIQKMRKRNPREIDHQNIKRDFQRAQQQLNEQTK